MRYGMGSSARGHLVLTTPLLVWGRRVWFRPHPLMCIHSRWFTPNFSPEGWCFPKPQVVVGMFTHQVRFRRGFFPGWFPPAVQIQISTNLGETVRWLAKGISNVYLSLSNPNITSIRMPIQQRSTFFPELVFYRRKP